MKLADVEWVETVTLSRLSQLKRELIALKHLPVWVDYEQMVGRYAEKLALLAEVQGERKERRRRVRRDYNSRLTGEALATALGDLARESQQDGRERRRLRQEREGAIAPYAQEIAQVNQQIESLKQAYKTLSSAWQAQMQSAYFAALARGDHPFVPLVIHYRDESLIVVDKPAGLLSVPGRQQHLQDSVMGRLRYQLPGYAFLQAVHRLDRDTSGLMLVATAADAHRLLSQQFAQRRVSKAYEAVLSGPVCSAFGTVDLPLWGNPDERPRQSVDFERGKLSQTDFKVLAAGDDEFPVQDCTRVEFSPCTGRTHQLRVHAAHAQGLNSPILGDALYGGAMPTERLHLHATRLEFVHPVTAEVLRFKSVAPF